MRRALELINQLKSKGLIKDYAIGGGVGATYYTEPIFTYDIDIFVVLHQENQGLITLSPVFDYLKEKGSTWKGEHILVGGYPVQFIVAAGLEGEAVLNANEVSYQEVKTKIISPEYLIPMFLNAGRSKDIVKVKMLLEQAKIDRNKLADILERYKLTSKFRRISRWNLKLKNTE